MIQTGRSHSQKVFNRTPDYCVSWPEIITKPLSDHFVALNGVGLELYGAGDRAGGAILRAGVSETQ